MLQNTQINLQVSLETWNTTDLGASSNLQLSEALLW